MLARLMSLIVVAQGTTCGTPNLRFANIDAWFDNQDCESCPSICCNSGHQYKAWTWLTGDPKYPGSARRCHCYLNPGISADDPQYAISGTCPGVKHTTAPGNGTPSSNETVSTGGFSNSALLGCQSHNDCPCMEACVSNTCYETVQVNQYWNAGDKDWSFHFPPAWSNEADGTGQWGEPFYAFKTAVPGAEQVHQYWNAGDKDWTFHFPPAWSNQADGTGQWGEPFYAFPGPVEGAQQVHQYWNGDNHDWSFHFPPAWSSQTDGTGQWGEPFYAFKYSDVCQSDQKGKDEPLVEAFSNANIVV